MIRLSTTWDDDLWRWTLTPDHAVGQPAGQLPVMSSPLAVLRRDGVRVIVDESTGSVVEITVDAADRSGALDDETLTVARDLIGTFDFATGQQVVLDDERHRRLVDLSARDAAGPSADGGAATTDEWPVDVTDTPTGTIDPSTATARFDADRGVLTVTAAVDPAAYPPAVAALRAELVDASGLVLAFAPFRLSTDPGRPEALAELVVAHDQQPAGGRVQVRAVRP